MQITQNGRNILNPGPIASYDLRPGNGVVTSGRRKRDGQKNGQGRNKGWKRGTPAPRGVSHVEYVLHTLLRLEK